MRKNIIPTYSKILFLIYCMFIEIKSANSSELNNPFPEVYKDTIALTFVRMGIENGSDIIPFNICHFSCPVSGSSLRGKFGSFKASRGRKSHEGIDIVDRFSSISGHHEVRAILPGKVIYADFNGRKEDDGYGHTIIIDHLIGLYSLYAHLTSDKIVSEGNFVKSGAIIGYFANELHNELSSGNVRSNKVDSQDKNQLHFELILGEAGYNFSKKDISIKYFKKMKHLVNPSYFIQYFCMIN